MVNKEAIGRFADNSLNEVKHLMDFGPIAARRSKRAHYHINETGLLDHISTGQQILDVGCGKGYIGGNIIKLIEGVQILSVDINDRPTKRMRGVTDDTFAKADACELPFSDESLDATISFFVMHHMPLKDQKRLLKENIRVTKNSGLIFIAEDTVPTGDDGQMRITTEADRRFNPDLSLKKPHNFRSREEWVDLFDELDLNIEETVNYHSGKVPHTFFVLSKKGVEKT